MEHTLSATSLSGFNKCLLGCALELSSLQFFKRCIKILLVLFSILLSWKKGKKKSQYYGFTDQFTSVVDSQQSTWNHQ